MQYAYMDSSFRELGALMSQRRGSVDGWLRGKDSGDISDLITRLQAMQPVRAADDRDIQELRKMAGLE